MLSFFLPHEGYDFNNNNKELYKLNHQEPCTNIQTDITAMLTSTIEIPAYTLNKYTHALGMLIGRIGSQ